MTKLFDLHEVNLDERMILFGPSDANLRAVEKVFGISLNEKEEWIVTDDPTDEKAVLRVFTMALDKIRKGESLTSFDMFKIAEEGKECKADEDPAELYKTAFGRSYDHKPIYPKTRGQKELLETFEKKDMTFAIGPAGTGKTYLSVVYAVNCLRLNKSKKIIITRPVVEAGENLGFLPGDLEEKIDPYLRPIFDALDQLISPVQRQHLMEKGIIEIAPLAYMRGRTLDDAIVILDEAQNTTVMQMKMFLTRMGFHSKMIINGDTTQIDLPYGKKSGLIDALERLSGVEEIGSVALTSRDVVRHPLVRKILVCYDSGQNGKTE